MLLSNSLLRANANRSVSTGLETMHPQRPHTPSCWPASRDGAELRAFCLTDADLETLLVLLCSGPHYCLPECSSKPVFPEAQTPGHTKESHSEYVAKLEKGTQVWQSLNPGLPAGRHGP